MTPAIPVCQRVPQLGQRSGELCLVLASSFLAASVCTSKISDAGPTLLVLWPLHCTVLYYTVLYYTVLYYTALYYTTL